jgi:hypothetical protein
VSSRAEAVDSEPSGIACGDERSVPNEARAQQRRGLRICVCVGNSKTESGIGYGELGVATVDLIPREASMIAEVLSATSTVFAFPASPAKPRDADAITGAKPHDAVSGFHHPTDNLVS